ncbi:hypothetical protein MMC24_000192 [Lignoscripta atroalba]|nr:hypothetical protein [Lignoscripta atroalba]
MPSEHHSLFRHNNPFPSHIVQRADEELDQLVSILQREGVKVYRPKEVDWNRVGGYTGAMPRDGLLTVRNWIIEAPFAWGCRSQEIQLAYDEVLTELERDTTVRVIRAPIPPSPDTLYEGSNAAVQSWSINDSRPAFDAADFMRFGKTLLGQYSNVTNQKGVDYLQANVPHGYSVEILDVDDPHAMHIDATLLPLRDGLLVYNPHRVTEASLRKHKVLAGWDLRPFPFSPQPHDSPPLFMTSAWLVMNVLVLDGRKVLVEEHEVEFMKWIKELGMTPIPCAFRHVYSIGGSFHCATVDLVREDGSGWKDVKLRL